LNLAVHSYSIVWILLEVVEGTRIRIRKEEGR
jgi:hypothetical protein